MKKVLSFVLLLCVASIASAQDNLPNASLVSIDGKSVELKEQTNKDGVTIVSLWATWCVPCLKELDAISDVYEDWQDETNVKLLAISVDDSRTVKRVKPLVNGKGWEYEVLLDTNNDLKRALNASNIPVTLLVKDNKIVYEHMGYVPGSENELYDKVKEFSN